MPYASNSDLPAQVRDALPEAAQSRFRTVVNSALERGLTDAKAFASGWTAVRNGWDKPDNGGKWVHKATGERSLFVSRPIENGHALVDWAKSQGFTTTLDPDDMHVTQCYSKEPLQWPYPNDDAILIVSNEGRDVGPLGDQGAMVLHFTSPTMLARYDQLKALGAKSDYPSFTPHITISWKADGVDPDKVEPYTGPLILGPERFREIDPDWSPDKVTEKANPNHDEIGRFATGDGGGGGGDVKMPDVPEPDGPLVFHGTTAAAVDHIISEGIIPAKSPGATGEHQATFGAVIEMPEGGTANAYFSASPKLAARFAEMAAKATGGTPVVIPVHLTSEQAKALTWDTRSGNSDVKLSTSIPASQCGKPAVGMAAIKTMANSFGEKWKQFTQTSEQRSGWNVDKPVYEFVPQQASAVRDIMGKARGGKVPEDKQQVVFMAFVVKDKPTEKAGARHNSSDRKMVQEMHDHSVKLGADCPGMAKHDDLDGERFEKFKALTTLDQSGESVARASIIKVDEELGLVFGWAMVCKESGQEYYDVQDDHIPEDAMLKASTDFMLSRRVAKEMHFGDETGTIVFAFPVTADVAKAMGITTDRTGLMIAMKPSSQALLDKFRSGEYTGFSIGGQRLVDETTEMAA